MTFTMHPLRSLPRFGRAAVVFVAAILAALCAAPQLAFAGSYTVSGTCAWEPYNQSPLHYAVYAGASFGPCPTLVARNVQGNFSSPGNGAAGGWRFVAPGGAVLSGAQLTLQAIGQSGWQAAVVADGGGGGTLVDCPGSSCPGGSVFHEYASWGLGGSLAVRTRVRCGNPGGCANGDVRGQLAIHTAAVTVSDGSAPAVGAGGDLAGGGWKGGTRQLAIDAHDNVGVKYVRALIDGAQVAEQDRTCVYSQKVPCPNGADTLSVPLGGLTEGAHTLTVQALDAADNWGGADRTIHVDTTAPVSPGNLTVEGGAGWRSANAWKLSWTNPAQKFAPIAGARYTLCPSEADSTNPDVAAKAKKACVTGERSKRELTEISDLKLPKAGQYFMRLWLIDAAGNANPDTAVKVTGLGYDPTPPEVAGFVAQDPNDPARVTVKASEDTSPISGGSIEIRRQHQQAWRPLATEVRGDTISAFVDDEALKKGVYVLRASVTNASGLQQSTDRGTDGAAKSLKLPIRMTSTLLAGRRAGKHCKQRRGKRSCTIVLRRKLDVALGRRASLRGRLAVRGKPIRNQPLEVWQRLNLAGAAWQRIATVQTGVSGRFRYKAPKGPARIVRIRFPGTPHVRGDNANVKLRVHARSTFGVSRRRVINGEYVTFSGELKGGSRPPSGVLVELQVRSRREWRTFAQPRADATTGAWSYEYRFETVRVGGRFKFRARVRRQAGYPFVTGHSREIGVSVRGL